jgi:chromate reductase
MKDKPVLTFTASPAFTGGVRAHAQLNETLHALGAIRVPHPQIAIPSAHSKIGSGVFRDEETLAFILKGVEKLIHSAASTERLTMQRCA